jgi:hypothetical protein
VISVLLWRFIGAVRSPREEAEKVSEKNAVPASTWILVNHPKNKLAGRRIQVEVNIAQTTVRAVSKTPI